jgi:hypothetical protein
MDEAFIARMKQLAAHPRPTPRKHSFSFYSIRVPCPEGHEIPKPEDIVVWFQEHMEIHLRRCISHFFQHVHRGCDDDQEKVLKAFLIHQLESTFRDCRPRYQRYIPGQKSYAWFFMYMFNDWIHEAYPPKARSDGNYNGDVIEITLE